MSNAEAKYKISADDRSGRAFKRFKQNVGGAEKAVGLLKSQLAALVGAAAITGMAKHAIEGADAIQKYALRLGVSTEALSEYRLAAELSGSSIGAVAKAFQQMERQTADAARGVGEAVDAFKLLGIEAAQLYALAPEDQFLKIADSLASVSNASDRTSAAMDVFGRGGAEMLQMMSQGAAGIRELREDAERLGMTLTQTEADTFAAALDSLTRMKGAATALGEALTLLLAPGIIKAAEGFANLVADFRGWVREATSSTMDKAIDYMREYGSSVENIARMTALRDIADSQRELDVTAGNAYRSLKRIGEVISFVNDGVIEQGEALSTGVHRIARFGNSYNDLAGQMNLTTKVIDNDANRVLGEHRKRLAEADEAAARVSATFAAAGVQVGSLWRSMAQLAKVGDPFDAENLAGVAQLLDRVAGAQDRIAVAFLRGEITGDTWLQLREQLDAYQGSLAGYHSILSRIVELEERRRAALAIQSGAAAGGAGPVIPTPTGAAASGYDAGTAAFEKLAGGNLAEPIADVGGSVTKLADELERVGSMTTEIIGLATAVEKLGELGAAGMDMFVDATVAALGGSRKAYGELGKAVLKWSADTLKAVASTAAGKALFYTAEGLAHLSMGNAGAAGNAFAAAKVYGVMAGYGAAAAIVMGAASQANAPAGTFMSPAEREQTTGLAGQTGSSSGSSTTTTSLAASPTAVHVTHIYQRDVYFGSQDQASAERIQEILDTGALHFEPEVP